MKYLSSAVIAGAMLLAVIPAFAKGSLNLSIAGANSGFNTITGKKTEKALIKTGGALAGSDITVIGSTSCKDSCAPTNVSLAVANSGFNSISGGEKNTIVTGNAVASSSITVVNFSSSFRR